MSIKLSINEPKKISSASLLQINVLYDGLFIILDEDGVIWLQQESLNFTQFYRSSSSQITCFDLIVSSKEGFTILAVGTSDGDIEFINRGGSIQKKIKEAHKGSIVFMRFANDQQTLVSSCIENCVKLWSKQGLLRSEIYKGDSPHYAIAWSPDDQVIVLGGSKILTYKRIKPGLKDLVVRACDSGTVLCVQWAQLDNVIFTTHEDCRYSLWDQMGRNLYQSKRYNLPFSNGVWMANSSHFVLANQSQILLINKQGQVLYDMSNTHQFYTLSVCKESNKILMGTTQGTVQEYNVNVFEEIQYKNVMIHFEDINQIKLHDISTDQDYHVDLEDQILQIQTYQDKIFLLTRNNCYIYSLSNLITPVIFQINKEPLIFHTISNNNIALVHQESPPKVYVYSHQGKYITQSKLSSQSINNNTFVMSDELFAEIDQSNQKILKLTDIINNKDYAKYEHENDIIKLTSNSITDSMQRKYLLLDSNKDLFLYQVSKNQAIKIASMVNSFQWHEELDIFAFTQQGKLQIYYQPESAFLDQELLELTTKKIDLTEKYFMDQMYGTLLTLQTPQRKKQVESLSQLAVTILKILQNKNEKIEDKIQKSLKLARFLKDDLVWGILSVYSLENRDTNTAEICMSELNCVEKIFYLCKINNEEDDIKAQAMLLKLINKSKESESLLLRQKKFYEVVKDLIDNFHFRRAHKIVTKLKQKNQQLSWLEEYVIFRRAEYLQKLGITNEYDELFKDKKTNKTLEDFKKFKENSNQ